MAVRLPLCDEQPSYPRRLYSEKNQFVTLWALIDPLRSLLMMVAKLYASGLHGLQSSLGALANKPPLELRNGG